MPCFLLKGEQGRVRGFVLLVDAGLPCNPVAQLQPTWIFSPKILKTRTTEIFTLSACLTIQRLRIFYDLGFGNVHAEDERRKRPARA